ncbi:MAG: hypothetical protein A2V77_10445 [Anaeromyxobacter sp. RBG_16_69_14]|nr:MAG: hypothetical protein A2V77_10445 [Anaeromyxobacter sp. RBG_16_69_14]
MRTLRAIVEDLDKLPDSEGTFKQWTRATMRLAKAELDLGHEDAARSAIERLVRSAPDVQVDRSLYPARFARRIEDARTQLKAQPTRELAVAASQPGVRVYVNGRDVGVAPVRLALARGRYRVSGSLGTLRAPPLHVDLGEEEQSILLDFTIPQALHPNQGPGIALSEGDRAGRLIAAGGFLGLDSILAVAIIEGGSVSHLVGSLYDVRRGMLTREGRVRLSDKTVPVGGIQALADFLATGQPTPGVEVPGAPDLKPPEAAEKPIDLRTPTVTATAKKSTGLGWVAFATGIATVGLAGFGVAEGLSASSSYDKAKNLRVNGNGPLIDPATQSSYDQFVADGNSAKNMATVGYVGAGVGLVATGILGYLSYKQSGEVGPFRF